MLNAHEVRIGTSGIVVPSTKVNFPEAFKNSSRLHYYASLFNTLEINSSFYKVPLRTTFEKWAREVPDDFKFTVKLWRDITHARKLAYTLDDLDFFMQAANGLGDKKGCLLVQFPASINVNYHREVENILRRLAQLDELKQWHIAVEVRNASWYTPAVYKMLTHYNAQLVFHDMPNSPTPLDCPIGSTVYLRFHGPTGDYKGSYPNDMIRASAQRINQWRNRGIEVYVYFNNTIGNALQNAQALQTYL